MIDLPKIRPSTEVALRSVTRRMVACAEGIHAMHTPKGVDAPFLLCLHPMCVMNAAALKEAQEALA